MPFLDQELKRNLRFMVLEVIKQIGSAARMLEGSQELDVEKLTSRDDYIDHLRTQIENRSFGLLRQRGRVEKATVDLLRATTTVTTNLERIADHAIGVVRQASRLDPPDFLRAYEPEPFFEAIFAGLQEVVSAYETVDTDAAVRVADRELELDALYKDRFQRILARLGEEGAQAPNLVTGLLVFHYLERMGDCLQNIGEAVISAEVGERMKMDAYRELAASLDKNTERPNLDEVDFVGLWGTRSGAQIGKVKAEGLEKAGGEAIFKRGHPSKLRKEREAMDRWSAVAPGLAPKIIRYQEAERDTMLVEYLEGRTLLEIVLNERMALAEQVVRRVQETLVEIWLDTRQDEPVKPRFLTQLEKRLPDVYLVHPYFKADAQEISGLHVSTLQELLDASRHLDDELEAPFSVFGHGDFNLDNVIYNAETDTVHFIDLHRSSRMDYAQDVSVFLVSNFRIPEFRPRRRAALNRVIDLQLEFARAFAAEQGDATFEARLALGLVRSLISSTRFDIRRTFAEAMLRRGLYLLERLGKVKDGNYAAFRLPRDVLIYTPEPTVASR